MPQFLNIVFIQNENAAEPLKILEEQGESAALQYLCQWDYAENDGETYDENPRGSGDFVYHEGNYIMTYNTSLGYIGLCKIIHSDSAGVPHCNTVFSCFVHTSGEEQNIRR